LAGIEKGLEYEEEWPYKPSEQTMDGVKQALIYYLIEVFKEVCKSGRVVTYDTGDRWGTRPILLWASDATLAAEDMARLIAEDVKTLKKATRPIPRSRPGRRTGKRK
jgi:hypothetical protein